MRVRVGGVVGFGVGGFRVGEVGGVVPERAEEVVVPGEGVGGSEGVGGVETLGEAVVIAECGVERDIAEK